MLTFLVAFPPKILIIGQHPSFHLKCWQHNHRGLFLQKYWMDHSFSQGPFLI